MSKNVTHPATVERLSIKDEVLTAAEMVWEEIPEARRIGQMDYPRMDSFVAQLRANPGQSARFPELYYGSPRHQLAKHYPDIEWACRSVGTTNGTWHNSYRVYGVFNPES